MIDFNKVTAEELNAMLPYDDISKCGVARRIVRFFRTNGTFNLPEYKALYDHAFEYLCNNADGEIPPEIRLLYKSLVGEYDKEPFFTKEDIELFL